jgi:hypothetical protein
MVIPIVRPLGDEPTAHPLRASCGHARHVGTCPVCQRVARVRAQAQLTAALAAREAWAGRAQPPRAA